MSQTLGTWGNYLTRPKIPLDGTFYDKPVQLNKRLYERRQSERTKIGLSVWIFGLSPTLLCIVGLQPFRRRGLSEPQLQLSLFDSSDLRQEGKIEMSSHYLDVRLSPKLYSSDKCGGGTFAKGFRSSQDIWNSSRRDLTRFKAKTNGTNKPIISTILIKKINKKTELFSITETYFPQSQMFSSS